MNKSSNRITNTLVNKCEDCKKRQLPSEMFLLKERLWNKISKGKTKIILCKKCTEKRLGRKLIRSDFQVSAPINKNYFQHIPKKKHKIDKGIISWNIWGNKQ